MPPTAGRRARRPAALDPARLLEAAGKGEAPGVLLLTGKDCFSRDALIEALRGAVVAPGFEGFDATVVPGEEVVGQDLVDGAEVLPMGGMAGGSRFVLVRRAERIREREAEPLAIYAGRPAPTACVVFVFDETKGPALAALKKTAPAIDFPAPRDYQLARWIETQAKRMGCPIEPDAARALAERSGEDFVLAMSELQRAALHAGGGRIARRTIEDLGASGRDTNVFHLADALLSGETPRAIRVLRDLYESGESGYMILGMLEGQLRRFLKMRSQVDAGQPARAVVRAASPMLPPAIQARLVGQLESFGEARLIEAFRSARAADRAVKGHGSGAELAHLEALVWKIASSAST